MGGDAVGLGMLDRLNVIDYVEPWHAELINLMAPETRVIYSDVDGTLLGPGGCLFLDSNHGFTSSPAQAIVSCHLHKIDVVLVSGRNRAQLHSDVRILGFKNWISELGCQIAYNLGEVLVSNIGDFQAGEETVWKAIEESGAPQLLLDEYDRRLEYHLPWSENREFTHMFRGRIDVEEANALLKKNGFTELKIIDNGKVRRRSARLDPQITEVHAYHLLPTASSKTSAVRKDQETRGIAKGMCAAIGDSIADLELAPEVGVLFLVRNAVLENPEILERLGDYPNVFITHEEMGLGWAEAIRFLIGREYR